MEMRVHEFEGIRNFRDFGGYLGAEGGQIKTGRLYRSAQFGEATEGDLTQLNTLGIALQADLRRPDERERHGHIWPAADVKVLTSDKGRAQEAPHVRFLTQVSVDAHDAHQWMAEYYRAAPFKAQHVDVFTDWFDGLLDLQTDESAVVNCAAGKDRTGILCALTHHVLGVDMDVVFEDYELTNQAAKVEERLPEMARMFNEHIGQTHPEEVYLPFIGVDAAFLKEALASMVEQSGSIDTYLADTLGVGSEKQGLLRTKFLD
ncbi:MAG: tyrosine-protein phosphatase [Pseudomonadota bacterium]